MSTPPARGRRNKTVERALLLLSAIFGMLLIVLWLLPRTGRPSVGADAPEAGTPTGPAAGPGPERSRGTSGQSEVVSLDDSRVPQKPSPSSDHGPGALGALAFVIDDAGGSLEMMARYLAFPGKLTISVLPGLIASQEVAMQAIAAGKDVILHCPMEAVNGANPGPGAIYSDSTRDEVLRTLTENLASVPLAVGINNHMGSRVTADPVIMGVVMEFLSQEGMFFLDSKTTPDSVARILAEEYNVPFLERDVFVDNIRDSEQIMTWIEHAKEIATRRGYAVLIGHASSEQTIEVIESTYADLLRSGFRLIGLVDLLRLTTGGEP